MAQIELDSYLFFFKNKYCKLDIQKHSTADTETVRKLHTIPVQHIITSCAFSSLSLNAFIIFFSF